MKYLNYIFLTVIGICVAGGVMAMSSDMSREAIAERIKPTAKVRLVSALNETTAVAQSTERSGEQVYNTACAACHTSGILNAPKINDAGDWEVRITQGIDVLLEHSINGFNAMPARGGCAACSDDEILAAIEYMTSEI